MHKKRMTIVFSVVVTTIIFFSSCTKNQQDGNIIFTRVKGRLQDMNYITGDSWRYIPGAEIVSIDPDDPEEPPEVLTEGFWSARSPEISYDGRYMLFAAQQKQNDPWQIWEMNLKNLKTRKIITTGENCIDPAYLPGNRMLFSKLTLNDSLKSGHALYTCNLDGSDARRITFSPHTYFASTVLKDGRVLTISGQIYPEQKKQVYMVLRPDGTKAEIFYKSSEGKILISRARETDDGKIVFIESDNINREGGNLVSVSYNRPLHSMITLSSEKNGSFNSVFPVRSGIMLVSWRKSEADRYALYEFDPVKITPGKVICSNPDYDLFEPVVAEEYSRPRKLPSEVDMGVKTGLLLCQDINFFGLPSSGNASSKPAADRIEVLGIDSSLGVVDVEEDGSFYLKVMADKPFRIQTVNKDGHVLNGPCEWIWLRPNERRGCVGCHEDPELVPENKIPLSVKKQPVNIPVHITKIKEKDVELE